MIVIPTTLQLYNQIKSDLEAAWDTPIPIFGKIFLRAMAGVQAAKIKLIYLGVASVQKNIFIDTADPEALGGSLERFGRIKLGRNPFPATAGQYVVEVNGDAGAIIPAGQTFKSNDDSVSPGKLFTMDAEYELTGSGDTITVRALEAGLDSKLEAGDFLSATSPIVNVDSQVEVQSESVEPQAAEDIEEYRAKGIEAYQLEPQGGAATDYRLWAADAQGVKQTYPYAKSGAPNEINVFVEATIADSTDGKGTPTGGILTAVAAVIAQDPDTSKPILERGREPLGVFLVHCLAITPLDIEIEITDFNGITADIQTLIFNALKTEIDKIRPFVAAADVLAEKNNILDVNKIISTILTARPGSIFGAVELTVDGNVVSTFTFEDGDIPHLDTVTYV